MNVCTTVARSSWRINDVLGQPAQLVQGLSSAWPARFYGLCRRKLPADTGGRQPGPNLFRSGGRAAWRPRLMASGGHARLDDERQNLRSPRSSDLCGARSASVSPFPTEDPWRDTTGVAGARCGHTVSRAGCWWSAICLGLVWNQCPDARRWRVGGFRALVPASLLLLSCHRPAWR